MPHPTTHLDNGLHGFGFEAGLVSHELIHGIAQVGGCVPHRIGGTSSPHRYQVVRGEQHLEEPLKGLAGNESCQAPGVEAEGTEDIWKGAQNLPCGWDLRETRRLITKYFCLGI